VEWRLLSADLLESGCAGDSQDLVVVDVDLLFQTAHLYNLYSNHIKLILSEEVA
jgi:hypothetical protein